MKNGIAIPEANLQNIAVFEEEPGDDIVAEIQRYASSKRRVYDWWGASHTPPPENAHVEYLDVVHIPAPEGVTRIAPCPCCSRFHAKFIHGLIGWFPEEKVIRIIGSTCFKNLDEAVEKQARVNLRRRQAERSDRQTIRFYAEGLDALISTVEACLPQFEEIDDLQHDIVENLLAIGLPLDRHVRAGELWVTDPEIGKGPDGKSTRRLLAVIKGHEIITMKPPEMNDETRRISRHLRRRLEAIRYMQRKIEGKAINDLDDETRKHIAENLPKVREMIARTFEGYRRRQAFVSSDTFSRLKEWSRHPGAPVSFDIYRENRWLSFETPNGGRRTLTIKRKVETPIPDLPAIDAKADTRESA